jgi:hypothetical protein
VSEQTEEEYLIERLSKLLAEISVIVNGPQPMGVLWSYADLPQKVQALKDAVPQPQAALLTNPYTGTPRDYRDVESDPAGVLIQEPGAPLRAAPPRPQASAEDVMFVDELLRQSGLAGPMMKAAWQRIRASLGVGK